MGEAHRLEERPVDRDDVAGGHGQREADLTIELQGVGKLEEIGSVTSGWLRHGASVPLVQ